MRAYSHQAYVRPRCRRRAASLTPFHSLRVGNAGGQLVWNVRTWPEMPREKAQAAPTARLKVPMRRRGADCLVVATKRGNARGAKGAGHRRWAWANWVKPGRALMFSGRRQPSCGDTSRMNREVQVRICEGLGVKLPGPTRHPSVLLNFSSTQAVPRVASGATAGERHPDTA